MLKTKFHLFWPPVEKLLEKLLVAPPGKIPSVAHAHKHVKWHHFCEKLCCITPPGSTVQQNRCGKQPTAGWQTVQGVFCQTITKSYQITDDMLKIISTKYWPKFCNVFFIKRFTLSLDPILIVLLKLTIFRQKSGEAMPTQKYKWGSRGPCGPPGSTTYGCRVRQQWELWSEVLTFWAALKQLSENKNDATCVASLRLIKTKNFNMVLSFCQHWHLTWQNWANWDALTWHRWKLPKNCASINSMTTLINLSLKLTAKSLIVD